MYEVVDKNGNVATTHATKGSAETWIALMASCGKFGYTIREKG